MYRRLYFVFPDEAQAAAAVDEIEALGVHRRHVHAIPGKGVTLTRLALAGLIASLFRGFSGWSALAIAVMIASLVAGALFALRVPDTHLDEFQGALAHEDVLLMVDVPRNRVAEVEALVERRHPEATAGGVGFTIENLGI